MKKLSFKTKFFNAFRNVAKLRPVEDFLVGKTQGKAPSNLFVKLIPNYYQYNSGEIRTVKRGGLNFQLDISDYMEYVIYYGMNAEPRGRMEELFSDGDTVLDVGANIGETLLYFAQRNENGKNIGFEPVPYIFNRLKKNISLNKFESIKIENLAISDVKEKLSFRMPDNQNSGGVRMRKDNSKDKYGADKEVQAITLDEYVFTNGFKKVDFIKIDVEGFEYNVISGAEKTLREYKPKLFIEIDDVMLNQQQVSARQIFEKLKSFSYRICDSENLKEIDLSQDFTNCHFDIICLS